MARSENSLCRPLHHSGERQAADVAERVLQPHDRSFENGGAWITDAVDAMSHSHDAPTRGQLGLDPSFRARRVADRVEHVEHGARCAAVQRSLQRAERRNDRGHEIGARRSDDARCERRCIQAVIADVDRLRAHRKGRAGDIAAAAGALKWGEPVLDSALTSIDTEGPRYRGTLATDLAEGGASFESVAELLWTGSLPPESPRWKASSSISPRKLAPLFDEHADATSAFSLVVGALGAHSATALASKASLDHADELVLARDVCLHLAAAPGLLHSPERFEAALSAESVAHAVAIALGVKRSRAAVPAIEKALVLCADHELNVSAFAARVVASAGAELHACVSAALAALSGHRHGGMSRRVESLLREIETPERARVVVQERLRRGEEIPGFGHPLYRDGDPRGEALLALARGIAGPGPLRVLHAVVRAMRERRREPPTLDVGLVALSRALGLPDGSAFAIFAVGRAAGWIAHVLEQRSDPHLLRPRARYVGV